MHTAALEEDLDPDRLSFIRSLQVVRRQVIARPAFPPEQIAAAVQVAVEELLTELLRPRRLRAFPRAVRNVSSRLRHLRSGGLYEGLL